MPNLTSFFVVNIKPPDSLGVHFRFTDEQLNQKLSVAGFMGYLKGKSSILIYQKYANLKFKYRNREFWCRGYYVDTVGKNKKAIQEYIANQLKEDKEMEQMTIFETIDPFKK